jgi:hypothetical protein
LLEAHGYEIGIVRERPAFVEALITKDRDQVLLQWTCDSAYRFFPLVEHPDFGLTLHPFDLATNKVLALVASLLRRGASAGAAGGGRRGCGGVPDRGLSYPSLLILAQPPS